MAADEPEFACAVKHGLEGERMSGATAETKLWRYCHAGGRKLPKGTIVGELDGSHEGLLLISSDAEVARLISLAAAGWVSHFIAEFKAPVKPEQVERIAGTPVVDGVHFGPVAARLLKPASKGVWLDIALREGRGRDVARLLQSAGLKPRRLARTAFGPYHLGGLQAGALEEVPQQDWQKQLGGKFTDKHENRGRQVQGAASRGARR